MSDDGGFVYPRIDNDGYAISEGIARRDWLAGLAMQAIGQNWTLILNAMTGKEVLRSRQEMIATHAYEIADVMIAESKKEKE